MTRWGLVMMSAAMLAMPAVAQPRRDGAQLLRDVRKLSVLGSALFVAAHPDDENTRLLATLANESLVRTSYLSFTRGEGGQNLIGPELGPLLGVIRTQELLAARRVDGAEQFFTRARDFGYSKSVDETLSIWDHDRVLADAVFVIRSLRPDVLITRFALEGGDTHGHHTASARLALEAFKAAADPTFHPEQLEQVGVWQAKRIVWNAWVPDGGAEKLPAGTFSWDSSLYSPLLGFSYGELAAESRSMHKSQGFGAAPVHGSNPEYFVPLAGAPAKSGLFDDVDVSWKRVPGSEKLSALLAKAATEFRVDAPAASVPVLLTALDEMRRLPAHPWKEKKLAELVDVLVACAGVFTEATVSAPSVVAGARVDVTLTTLERTSVALTLEQVNVGVATASPAVKLEKSKASQQVVTVDAPMVHTSPYFLELPPAKGAWTLDAKHPIGLPELGPALTAEFTFSAGTTRFSVRRPVVFKWVDATAGERFRPLEVLPAVVVKASVDLLAFTDTSARDVTVVVTANAEQQRGELKLELPAGFSVEPATSTFDLAKKGSTAELVFKLKRAASASRGEAAVLVNGLAAHSLTRVDYPHLPMQVVLTPARVRLLPLELKRGKTKRVGYIVGAGDDVPAALRQAGYEVSLLSDEQLKSAPLAGFDAIVVGIRAYNTNPRLPSVYAKLMQYVKDGGTLVAQYNTRNWLSNVPAEMGPFPFEISQDRVTDEEAVVSLEKHRVLQSPNLITADDFSGWVQERGLYFAAKFDATKYETPLSMNDPNEAPSKGSLLIARHGKGRFVYTGLSFFRQLPAGVPGAYRLFANLLDHDG